MHFQVIYHQWSGYGMYSGGQTLVVDKHCSDCWPHEVYGVFCKHEAH